MQIVLAIEPDLRQAAIIKRIVRDKVLADVVVVDTRDAALEAIRKEIPDVLLLSALLSPRDEDELIAHLRLLDGADHLQTHTIPQLAGTSADREEGRSRGLFGLFGRKKDKDDASAAGCDPDLFAEEIRTYLQRAHEKKEERKFLLEQGIEIETPGPIASSSNAGRAEPAAAESNDQADSGSSWSSPFEWRPKSSGASQPRAASPEPAVASHESVVDDPAPSILRTDRAIVEDEPVIAAAAPVLQDAPSVIQPEPLILEPGNETPDPVVEQAPAPYESIVLPQSAAPEPVNSDAVAARAADPWTVEYGGRAVLPSEPAMVGYTAPFAEPPAEPIALSKSAMSPDIEPVDEQIEPSYEPLIADHHAADEHVPLVMETRASDEDDLSRVSQELDLQLDDTSEHASVDLTADLDDPVIELSARDMATDSDATAITIDDVPDAAWQSDRAPGEVHEPIPVASRSRRRSKSSGPQTSVLRLMPLAIWARAEVDKPAKPQAAASEELPPRTVNDELRDLMSRLALPPNVAGVSYARGVRIRRVRVPGGRDARKGETPGPVILSKKALEEQRART